MGISIEPTPEILAARVARALAELLIFDFEGIALERYVSDAPDCPCQRGAETAQRIAELCKKLVLELDRYERYENICQNIEADAEDF
jgi:hypothetical protein